MNTDRLWLIRNQNGSILGPMTFANLMTELTSGTIPIDSELCPENSYWFTFHDLDDMRLHFNEDQLAIILKSLRGGLDSDDDSTRADIVLPQYSAPKFNSDSANRMKTPFGLERVQFFIIFFFGGLIAALLIVIWLLNRLES